MSEVVQPKGQFDCAYPECSPCNRLILGLDWFLHPAVSIGVMAGDMVYGYRKVRLVSQFLLQYKSLCLFYYLKNIVQDSTAILVQKLNIISSNI